MFLIHVFLTERKGRVRYVYRFSLSLLYLLLSREIDRFLTLSIIRLDVFWSLRRRCCIGCRLVKPAVLLGRVLG